MDEIWTPHQVTRADGTVVESRRFNKEAFDRLNPEPDWHDAAFRDEFLKMLPFSLRHECEVPSGVDLETHPLEDMQEVFQGAAIRWFMQMTPNAWGSAAQTRLADGRDVVLRSFRRYRKRWRDVTDKPMHWDDWRVLEVDRGAGFLCGVLRQWVPAQPNGALLPSLATELEGDPDWQTILRCWPRRYRNRDKPLPDLPWWSYHPLTRENVHHGHNSVDVEHPLDTTTVVSLQQHLAARGLPFDGRAARYAIWRILGGSVEETPPEIVPTRGGWVETFVICQRPDLSQAQASVDVNTSTWSDLFDGKARLEPLLLTKPQIIQTTVSGNWTGDEHWDTVAGRVKLAHRRWVSRIGQFQLPLTFHQLRGQFPALAGTARRGRPETYPERTAWWKSLGSPRYVTNDLIRARAEVEFREHQMATQPHTDMALSTLISDVRRWLQHRNVSCESLRK